MGDVNAVKKGKVGKRVARRVAGKVTGRSLGKHCLSLDPPGFGSQCVSYGKTGFPPLSIA